MTGPLAAAFDVLGEIGRGGRTIVYRVRRHGGEYAMKVLLPRVEPEVSDRAFRREAALLACVDHPGVARVHEVGTVQGRPYLIMDLVPGRRLSQVLADGPLTVDHVIAIGIDMADALAATHRAGVVHRDIKPDNILIGPDGHARVIDFGLALGPRDPDHQGITGTLVYGAPEQSGMVDREVDGRADLYGLGSVLYECAVGRPPFLATEVGLLLRMHASVPAPDPRDFRPDLPPMLAAIIGRLLAKDPDDRYQSGVGLSADLRRLAADRTTPFPLGSADEPVGTRADYRLVGRDAELAALTARWERARGGDGGVAVIEGASGSGKSRLAREVTAVAARGGGLVLFGRSEPDLTVPMAPLRDAIDGYLHQVQRLAEDERRAAVQRLVAAAAPYGSLLRRLSPALGFLSDAPEPAGTDDRSLQSAAAVAAFLAALARSAGGAVLYLDDVQWLDDTTRRVLRHLKAELPGAPLLVLATARDDATGGGSAVTALSSLLGDALDLVVRLEPLPPAAMGELLSAVTGGMRMEESMTARLAARSGGNPFTMLEYVTALMRSGLLRPSWGVWEADVEQLRTLDLPTDAVALVLDRLTGLDPESRQLLGVAAAVGARFSPDIVAEVCRIRPDRMREVVNAAAWRYLVEHSDGGQFAFLHDRIREALLAQFDEAALVGVHERIADVLDRRDDNDPERIYALAQHCLLGEAGRDPPRLVRACTTAGRLALADQAPTQALAFLASAATAAAAAGIVLDSGFLQLLGIAQHRAGRLDDAVATLRRARAATTDRVERANILALAARVYDSDWKTAQEIAAVEQALGELGQPLPRHRPLLVLTTAGRFLVGLLIGLTRIGYGSARGARRDLNRLVASLYDVGTLANVRQLSPTMGVAMALRELYPANRIGVGSERVRAYAGLAHLAGSAGLARINRRVLARAAAMAAESDDPVLIGYVEWVRALGRYFFGADQGQSVHQVFTEQGRWLEVGQFLDLLHTLFWDALLRGDLTMAREVAERRRAVVTASGQINRTTQNGGVASLLAFRGEEQEAIDQLDLVRTEAGAVPLPWERMSILYETMVVAIEGQDLGAAFDDAVDQFDALGLSRMAVTLILPGIYVYRAYGRLQQCRMADPGQRPVRLAQAREAVALLGRAAKIPIVKAHHRVARAALAQVSGDDRRALLELNESEPVIRAVDAPLVSIEASRVRAHALRALGFEAEAGRQARFARAIAVEQDWPHRTGRLTAEFGLAPVPSPLGGERIEDRTAPGLDRQRLDAIEQVGLAASRVLDPAKLVDIALDQMVRILGAERAFVFLVEGDPPQLIPHSGRDADGNSLRELTGYSATLVRRVHDTRQALVITGTEEGAALGAQSVVLHGLRSILVAPLQLEGRQLGVVYLDSRVAKGIFTADDLGVLTVITNHIAVALETARAAQLEVAITAANKQRDVAETMRDALIDVGGTLEPDQVLRRLLTTVVELTGGGAGWLALPETGRVRLITGGEATDSPEWSTVDGDESLARLFDVDAVVVETDLARCPELITRTFASARSWMAVPLAAHGERLGIALLANRTPDAYAHGSAEVAAAVVGQGMIAYENARLFAQVRQLATLDPLTGLANRRHLFDLAGRLMAQARRRHQPLIAMMVDIDFFKSVNDRYGHQVGDEVIRAVAGRLGDHGRADHLVGRYGGEEFAILLATSIENAAAMAERLRAAIADAPIATSSALVRVTISIGVTRLQPTDPDVNALLARADHLMYAAKDAGRNHVEIG